MPCEIRGYTSALTPTPENNASASLKLNFKVFCAEYIHAGQAVGGINLHLNHHPIQANDCTGEHAREHGISLDCSGRIVNKVVG
jgi:hypothetical protein